MSGAIIGGIVALVAWCGLFGYLVVLNQRLIAAVAELSGAPATSPAPAVTVMEVDS